ncbi:MAG: galactokinase family protein [Clostridia bacterium]|nr:galactokinase family protein [Clostridia bacterium]
MNLQEAFEHYFQDISPEGRVHCPYRVCPIGAHVDHQHGLVSGFALDHGVNLIYAKSDEPIIEIHSLNFEGQIRFTIKSEPHIHRDWGDYARAAMKSLFEHGYEIKHGFSGVIEGTLPVGGLSSSAAVVLAYLAVLCRVNDLSPKRSDIIKMALWAEQKFIGLNIGKLDQSCEVYCKKNHLLYLDTQDDSYENIPCSVNMSPYKIGIFFSGVPRALVNSAYNARVDECRAAAYSLKAYGGMDYEKIADTYLREVPEELFRKYKGRLPENFSKRAEHYYSEYSRVKKGVEAWKKGDLHAFGQIIFESGNSSIYNYESGSPELRTLHKIMLDTAGIYGGRFSGAGFKGCCMAIVDPNYTEQIEETVTKKYLEAFPELRGKFSVHFCDTSDGVTL